MILKRVKRKNSDHILNGIREDSNKTYKCKNILDFPKLKKEQKKAYFADRLCGGFTNKRFGAPLLPSSTEQNIETAQRLLCPKAAKQH